MNDSDLVCTVCGRTSSTNFASSLRAGWEKCCGYTMRLVTTRADIGEATRDALSTLSDRSRMQTP